MSCDCQIAAAVKFHVGELRIELQKLDAAAIYIYISPFYYNTNLRQLQLYEAVKFSAVRILKLFKL